MYNIHKHLRTSAFREHVLASCEQARGTRPSGRLIGIAWERAMYRALIETQTQTRVQWDPRSNRSGADITYDGVGYSLKTTTLRESKCAALNSYKLARCDSDAEAVREIDRPHRHNYDWYSILAWTVFRDPSLLATPGLYVLPSDLTRASRFYWDYDDDGSFMTDVRDGIRLVIRKDKRGKRMLWIKMNFDAEAIAGGRLF